MASSRRHRTVSVPATSEAGVPERPAAEPPQAPSARPVTPPTAAARWRVPLIAVAALRYAVPLLALPLVGVLTPEDVGLLTLLRPSKEVLLLAGGLTRARDMPGLAVTFLAYLPLMVGGVWAFFGLGRAYADDLRAGTPPAWLARIVPPARLAVAQSVLARRGPAVAILGRLAALPPTVLAAAAGTSDVRTRDYLVADLIGALVSFGAVFGIGLALGSAYERGGPWVTVGALVLVVLAVVLVTRWLRAETRAMP